jgi:hypothetical protein
MRFGACAWCAVAAIAGAQPVRITEVLSNPTEAQGGQKAGEFVEVFNAGDTPVDLKGWSVADRDARDALLPFRANGSTLLPPRSFGLILDADYKDGFDIPPETTLFKPENAAIGNGLSTTDVVRLLDGSGTLVDTFTPPSAARSGVSFERVNVDAPDSPENWQHSTDLSGATPGRPSSPPRDRPPPPPAADVRTGVVVINEVLFRPKPDAPEWVEVFNRADVPVAANGWTLSDARDKPVEIPHGVVPAQGYAILTPNAEDFRTAHPETPPETVVLEASLPILNDDGDTLTLRAADGTVLDRIEYTQTGAEPGQSLERRDPAQDSARLANWVRSVHLQGSTPGAENSVRHDPGPRSLLEASPNPFDPQAGPVRLRFEAPLSARVTLRVFDSAGRLVRVLLDDAPHGGRQTVEWDGKGEDTVIVRAGVYIAQLLAVGDGRPRAAAVAIVVGEP